MIIFRDISSRTRSRGAQLSSDASLPDPERRFHLKILSFVNLSFQFSGTFLHERGPEQPDLLLMTVCPTLREGPISKYWEFWKFIISIFRDISSRTRSRAARLPLPPSSEDQNNVLLERFLPNHMRGTRSGPVRLPTPPQDEVPGPPGHVDCDPSNDNVLLQRYLPNHRRQ